MGSGAAAMRVEIDFSVRTVSLLLIVLASVLLMLLGLTRIDRRRRDFFPQLELLPEAERDRVWVHAKEHAPDPARLGGLFVLLGAWAVMFGSPVLRIVETAVGANTDTRKLLIELPVFLVVFVGGPWVKLLLLHRHVDRRLCQEISERGVLYSVGRS